MDKTRLYIAGPMSGLPDYNYPAFNEAAAVLRGFGFQVENPAENPPQGSWEGYMRQSITQMLICDEAVFLDGWHLSTGAMLENYIAVRIGMPTHGYDNLIQKLRN